MTPQLERFLDLMVQLRGTEPGQALSQFIAEMIEDRRNDLEYAVDSTTLHRTQGCITSLREVLRYMNTPEEVRRVHQEMGNPWDVTGGATGKAGPEEN